MDTGNELTILLIGVAAALSTFHHYFAAEGEKRKSPLFISLLGVSIVTQLVTQGLQFHNAVITSREQERRTSAALYAFNQTQEKLLLKVADTRISDSNAYLVGYWYFKRGFPEYLKHGNTEMATKYLKLARTYLALAIHTKRFLPESYYLLGTMNRATQSDWTEARKDFDIAISADHEYAAAYYGRAILRQESKDIEGALDDLEQAAMLSVICCWDLSDPQEQADLSKVIRDTDRYHKISELCAARFGLLTPAQPPPKTHPNPKVPTSSQDGNHARQALEIPRNAA
jgi:hypothetical protein